MNSYYTQLVRIFEKGKSRNNLLQYLKSTFVHFSQADAGYQVEKIREIFVWVYSGIRVLFGLYCHSRSVGEFHDHIA